MKKCLNCGNEQVSGAFCGSCGGKLQEAGVENTKEQAIKDESAAREKQMVNDEPAFQQSAATNSERTVQKPAASTISPEYTANPTADAIKTKSQAYWAFFGRIIGNPTRAIHLKENEFANSLISAVIYILTFALSLYSLINSIYRYISFIGEGAPFDTFVRAAFFAVIVGGISFVSMIIMAKVNQSTVTAKALFTKFGALAVPFTIINALALLMSISGGYKLTIVLLSFSLLMYLYFIPALLVFAQKPGNPQKDQRVYASIGTVGIALVVNYILFVYMLNEMLAEFENVFRF